MLRRALAIVLLLFVSGHAAAQDLVLVGATVYPTPAAAPIPNAAVVIAGGKITAVGPRAQVKAPSAAEVLDCTGRVITAGFWNSHVHFMEHKWADAAHIPAGELAAQMQDSFTRYGFTAVFDLSSIPENTAALRRRTDAGDVAGPRILTTGLGLLPANAQIPEAAGAAMGWMPSKPPEIADAAQADAAASAALQGGADGVKLFMSAPSKAVLSPEIVEAAATAAHRRGKPVLVHPNSGADVLTAVRGGADIIAHTTPFAGPWDDAVLGAMKERGVALIPTLGLWKSVMRHGRRSAQDKVVEAALAQVKAWRGRGGVILFGTDLGAVDPDPAEEYALMAAAGMDFRDILASLTTAPARQFKNGGDLGEVAPGFRADLVVLAADPARDPRKLARVLYTLRDGKVIFRGE